MAGGGHSGARRVFEALNTLEGIIEGIGAEEEVTEGELRALGKWLGAYRDLSRCTPFDELIPIVSEAVRDEHLDGEERLDLLWACGRYSKKNRYFDRVTSDLHRLRGIVAGIVADGVIEVGELEYLKRWIDAHGSLKGMWPYDEVESLVVGVLRDGRVSAAEHKMLLGFFAEFGDVFGGEAAGEESAEGEMTVSGVCAVRPEVVFDEKMFCFTGRATELSRAELEGLVAQLNGRATRALTADVDYLVVGAGGSPAWAFACYGRKIEQAMAWRREGARIQVVHEADFLDAVEDNC